MMIRATSIALTFALYGYADAAGCHPAFSGSATYGPGDYVSATSTVETTTACTCGDSGCPTPTGQTSGCSTTTTTTETHNYQCVSGANSAFCDKDGYQPGTSLYWSQAWTKESAECSGAVTPTPPPTPAVWSSADSGCPGAFVAGTDYAAAEKVSLAGTAYTAVYECAAAPNNQFCGKAGYEPGTGQYWAVVWTLLGSCSGTISPTSSPNYSTLTDAGGCPDPWEAGVNKYEENDRVSKNGLVFQCAAFPFSGFCGQTGYEPMNDEGTEYWKDAWTVVGHCEGTISPTATPSFDPNNHVGGCPDEWVGGTNTAYEEGDMVSITVSTTPLQKIAYTCKAWPWSGFCGLYAPNSGLQEDQQGWTMNGGCSGTIAPTTAPTFATLSLVAGGCPPDYDESNLSTSGIEAGDQVSLVVSTSPDRRVVYECKSGAAAAYCIQPAFIPGGQYSAMAWDLKGYCDGTMSPTAAPTAYVNGDQPTAPAQCTSPATVKECFYEKDVTTTGVTCTCSDADCPNPNGETTGCTKDVTETTCPSVDTYSSSATYEAGDVVRIGTKKFQCKAWPYYLWCGNSAYEPSLEAGVWTDAWSEIGDCP